MVDFTKLKPCPFCGSEELSVDSGIIKSDPDMEVYYVHCGSCQCRTGYYGHARYAIDAWNGRAKIRRCKSW